MRLANFTFVFDPVRDRWMNLSCCYLDEGPHGKEVGQHGGKTLSQAALGNEAKFQLGKTNGIISLLPGPAWDVQKVGLRGEKHRGVVALQTFNC